jgi:dihydropteroate synthase
MDRYRAAAMATFSPEERIRLDAQLSQRTIQLDPNGYVLIKLDREKGELIVEWFSNGINEQGLATNPETGEVLACKGSAPREPIKIFKGRSAKELGVALTETNEQPFISKLDHALYIGRELQRAEACLENGKDYVQD